MDTVPVWAEQSFGTQVLVVGASLVVAAFLIQVQVPTAASPGQLPWLAVTWAGLLPVAAVIQAMAALPPLPLDSQRLFPESALQVEQARRQSARCAHVVLASATLCHSSGETDVISRV